MNIISKFAAAASTTISQGGKATEPPSPALSPTQKMSTNNAPSLTTAVLSVPGSVDTSSLGLSDAQLKRQSLECLVAVLRSLVAWGTAAGKSVDDGGALVSARSQAEESKREPPTPEANLERLSANGGSAENFRLSTPDIVDDPAMFQNAKQKKNTLLEGIKKFNYKPKRVSPGLLLL